MFEFILKYFKKDAESMLHGGFKLRHFYDAEHRNVRNSWY